MHDGGLSWRGSAWANTYEVWASSGHVKHLSHWERIAHGVIDAVNENKTWFALPRNETGQHFKMRGVTLEGAPGAFSNVVEMPAENGNC